jgi:hypothetical protein
VFCKIEFSRIAENMQKAGFAAATNSPAAGSNPLPPGCSFPHS